MLALPTPYIWHLHLPRGQKLALAGIFLVGILYASTYSSQGPPRSSSRGFANLVRSVTVVSVVRLSYLLRGDLTNPDITWNFVDIGLWSIIEGNIAIFCGMEPLIPHTCCPFRAACNPLANEPKLASPSFALSSASSALESCIYLPTTPKRVRSNTAASTARAPPAKRPRQTPPPTAAAQVPARMRCLTMTTRAPSATGKVTVASACRRRTPAHLRAEVAAAAGVGAAVTWKRMTVRSYGCLLTTGAARLQSRQRGGGQRAGTTARSRRSSSGIWTAGEHRR